MARSLRIHLQEELRAECCGHWFSFLQSLPFFTSSSAPWSIKQRCIMKASGLIDIFLFFFHQFVLSILLSVRSITFLFQEINGIILVVYHLIQLK